jgi:hypothetical protein
LRYKHRSEWFFRQELYNLIQVERQGEKKLALDLYSYLYDQGIEFHIEPSSISGEIDLIAAQGSKDPLLLDAKIFDGDSRGKQYIRKAFQQIYTYSCQYDEPFGYLMIYKITEKDLHFALPLTRFSDLPVVTYNYKTIFLIVVDIYPNIKPVSQRRPIQSAEIKHGELVAIIEDTN